MQGMKFLTFGANNSPNDKLKQNLDRFRHIKDSTFLTLWRHKKFSKSPDL